MRVQSVREDIASWRTDFPEYQVYFFEPGLRMPEGGTYPAATSTYLLTGFRNVHHVMGWADQNAHGRRYIVYVVVDDPRATEYGLLQLCGDDPNRPDDPHRAPTLDQPKHLRLDVPRGHRRDRNPDT
jgi:hypothetical protein